MTIFFKGSFIKDFQRLVDEVCLPWSLPSSSPFTIVRVPEDTKKDVRTICLSIFPKIKSLREFDIYPLKKLRGFKFYYRIKMKDFRIGFKKSDNEVIFMRVLHRKDIYKYFP